MIEKDFFAAVALVFVFEGLLPFVNPTMWRRTIALIASQNDRALRKMGLFSMVIGVGLLYLVR